MTVAVLDACVLYSASLRDFFMWLAVGFVFQPKWTEEIHQEWMDSVLEQRPELSRSALERTRDLMNQWGRDWSCVGYRAHLPSLRLPDPEDCHVLAAAIAGNASLLVTFNLTDFPAAILEPHGVRPIHPDAFALALLEQDRALMCEAIRRHRLALTAPAKTVEQYLERLERCGLVRTVEALRDVAVDL